MSATKRVRVLIIDDEPLARRRVRKLLAADAEIEVTGDCANGREAVEAIRTHKPDLIFLDVQMPGANGFQVLEALDADTTPLVVFVTAYDRYAVKAFDVQAVDYLLKPFDRRRFEQAMRKAKEKLHGGQSQGFATRTLTMLEGLKSGPRYLDRLVVKSSGRVFFLKTLEIDWIEAEGKYVRLHTGKQSHLLREAISSLESQLDPQQFLRIHRSTIVNIDRIKELQPWFSGEFRVVLNDGSLLTLSRGYKRKLTEVLGASL